MKMIFSERNKIVNAIPAVDGNDTAIASDIVSMKNYRHCTFILTFGVVNGSASASTGTSNESNLIAYKGENVTTCTTAFAAKYRAEVTSGGDTLEALTTLPATGVSMGTGKTLDVTGDKAIIVVEIDASDLEPTVAHPYDTVKIGFRFSAHSVLLSAVAVLSQPRYADDKQPSAIIN
jgi:hypothetical protein